MPRRIGAWRVPTLGALAVLACSACGAGSTPSTAAPGSAAPITVQASETTCVMGTTQLHGPSVTFAVSNTGTGSNEFSILNPTDGRELFDIEDVMPGQTKLLQATLTPGTYTGACVPGTDKAPPPQVYIRNTLQVS